MKNKKESGKAKTPLNMFIEKRWSIFIIVIVGFILYARTISFGFSPLDESNLIIERIDWYKDASNMPSLFVKGVFDNKNMGESYYRPVLMLTFMTDTLIGGGNPKVYHFTNILLHIIASVLCFLLLLRFLPNRRNAFILSLFFLVHPVFTHAVAWIPGRNDTLLAIFVLACFIFFIDFLHYRKWYQLILHLVFLFLTLLTKESAFVIVPALMLYYWLFYEKRSLRNVLTYSIIWISLAIVWFLLKNSIIKTEANLALFDFKKIFLDASQAMVIYIGKIFLPFNQAVLPTVKGTTIFIGLAVIAVLIAVAIKNKISDSRKLIFGLTWFILFLSIPLFLATFDGMGLHYEHRLYVPMIGFLIFLSCLQLKIPNQTAWLIATLSFFFIKTLVRSEVYKDSFSFAKAAVDESPNLPMSYNLRGLEYKKKNNLKQAASDFSSALKIDSLYVRALFNLGVTNTEMGAPAMAIENLNQGLKIDSLNAGALYARGNAYFDLNDFRHAIADYTKCIDIYPQYGKAYNNRGNAYSNLKLFDKAIPDYTKAIQKDPKNVLAYSNRSNAYFETGKYSEALSDIENAMTIKPSDDFMATKKQIIAAMHHSNPNEKQELSFIEQQLLPKAIEYFKNKQYQEAIDIFKQLAAEADKAGLKRNKLSHLNNIGLCYMKMNRPQEAEQTFSQIILLDTKYEKAYANLGFLNKQRGNIKLALAFYKSAQKINPANSMYAVEIANLERIK
jgi:protein O-mannosyl-transferase